MFFVDLPPRLHGSKEEWEWGLFTKKNDLAKRILEPYGITYLETNDSLLKRINDERTASGEEFLTTGLHWCSPGPFSATTHIFNLLLHELTLSPSLGTIGTTNAVHRQMRSQQQHARSRKSLRL